MLGRRMYLSIFMSAFLIAVIQRQCLGFGADEFDGDDDNDDNDDNDDGGDGDNTNAFDQILNTNDRTRDGLFSTGTINETMIEGDIVVTEDLLSQIQEFKTLEQNGMGLFDAIKRGTWPGGVVYYTYASTGTRTRLYSAVKAAVAEYTAKTCIRWKEFGVGRRPPNGRRNYVTFFIGGGCYSMIGMQSRPQKISLGRGCETKGVAIHEMMHALGFFHEQSRRDRDSHIVIYWANIQRRMWYNFQKYRLGQADTLGEPYDVNSIMHYGAYAFSKNRRQTIKSKRGVRLGQRKGLSTIDVRQLRKYYRCSNTGTGGKPCKDNYTFCSALGNFCRQPWVKKYCKKRCNLCSKPPVIPTSCKNKSPTVHCLYWAKRGYCKNSQYGGFMGKQCSRTCKTC